MRSARRAFRFTHQRYRAVTRDVWNPMNRWKSLVFTSLPSFRLRHMFSDHLSPSAQLASFSVHNLGHVLCDTQQVLVSVSSADEGETDGHLVRSFESRHVDDGLDGVTSGSADVARSSSIRHSTVHQLTTCKIVQVRSIDGIPGQRKDKTSIKSGRCRRVSQMGLHRTGVL